MSLRMQIDSNESCALQQREQIIFDHFSDPAFISQFIEFLSLEDRKGKDKFSPRRFCLFKVRFHIKILSHVIKCSTLSSRSDPVSLSGSRRDSSATSAMPSCQCCSHTWSDWWPTPTRASSAAWQRSSPV